MVVFEPSHRKTVREIEGTPIYPFYLPALTSGSKTVIDFAEDTPSCRKYLPFNEITVTNNSTSDVRVYINQSQNNHKDIPKGVILTISGYALWSIQIENTGTTDITANTVEFACQRVGKTSDEFFKSASKNVFFQALFGGG